MLALFGRSRQNFAEAFLPSLHRSSTAVSDCPLFPLLGIESGNTWKRYLCILKYDVRNSDIPVPMFVMVISVLINAVNAELNPICHQLALFGAHHFLHISRIRFNHEYRKTSMHLVSMQATYIHTYLLTYSLTHSLHGAEAFLRS